MPRTPPSQRHHLPFSTTRGRQQQSSSSSCYECSGGRRLNQVFLATCVASFVIQLLGSISSWQNAQLRSVVQISPQLEQQLREQQMDLGMSSGRRAQAVLQQHQQPPSLASAMNSYNSKLSSSADTTSATAAAEAESSSSSSLSSATESSASTQFGTPPHSGRLRVLVGILTADFQNDHSYRKRHRKLFQLWNDPRVCSLPDFKARPADQRYECQFIYTFVMGGNPTASPELVDDSRPMEVSKPVQGGKSADLNYPDVTLLNIRENMNEGKSQTWMKYGAEIAEEYDLDYVTKCDADSLFHLHEFFIWAYQHLPPAPYNKHVYVGALRDKAYWPRHETEQERIRFESYFGNNFEGVHLYVAGQMYLLSTDLAKFVGQEALRSKCSYCEGHEDHDISAMAFHSPDPVKLMVIGRSHRFWEHPVKGEPRWRRIWAREEARMKGVPFEGKLFNKNSTFQAVMQKQRIQQQQKMQ